MDDVLADCSKRRTFAVGKLLTSKGKYKQHKDYGKLYIGR